MEQRYEANRQTGLWLERLAWNVAAGAVLAVMILLLLGSLRWLDAISPNATAVSATVEAADQPPPEAAVAAPPRHSTDVAEFNRPSP